jgi:hypothetical protein
MRFPTSVRTHRLAPLAAAVGGALLLLSSPRPAAAQDWQLGAVLDVAASSRALALGQRDPGLALGHSDVTARGGLGSLFGAQVTVAAHQHDGKVEAELEEAWLETRTLPFGLQARAGRFASQIGAINAQHPHADDFVERPLLYRAFLGSHWFDDGLRLNWTAPTPIYLMLGAEVFRGRQLVPEAESSRSPGAIALSLKTGADIGRSHSWQVGAAWVDNRRVAAHEHEEEHAEEHGEVGHEEHEEEGHDHHDHAHGAEYSGGRMWLLDATWKWAPDGNNRERQLRVTAEFARITDLGEHATGGDRHQAAALSVVWRFAPAWEVGVRSDWLRVRMPHEDHFHDGRLREHAVMLAWKPTHGQTLRLQATTQRDAEGIEDAQRRSVQLQYVLSFGAHGAHTF